MTEMVTDILTPVLARDGDKIESYFTALEHECNDLDRPMRILHVQTVDMPDRPDEIKFVIVTEKPAKYQ